ncbi:type II toxin-antitoxin system RelE/ParE family toxin [Sphingomonas glacialis]|uniref:type II toxin-antitoxin system RelE/ParE family toxin n=1 Tax=Sphingomonas glacialis TaxID=658225 RepID=UPI0013869C70|nr:type II toxin-antitoxin system RelE/ParE family toxin [Sphingomonas glacialis]
MKIRWSARGNADVQRLWLFAADRDVGLAERLEEELRHRAELLAAFPKMGRRISDKGHREMSLVNLQCILRYRLADDVILILRVHHARENRETP